MSNTPTVTVMPMTVTLLPRNDMVILKIHTVDKVKSLYVPEKSNESKKLTVHAVGPKVEGLKAGDHVMMTGKMGEDFSLIPNHPDLLITREGNVVMVIEPLGETAEKSVDIIPTLPEQSPTKIGAFGGVPIPQDSYEQLHD